MKKRCKKTKRSSSPFILKRAIFQKKKKRRKKHRTPTASKKRKKGVTERNRLRIQRSKKRKKKKLKQIIQDLLLAIFGASLLVPFAFSFFITFSKVDGYGMLPALRNDDVVAVRKTNQLKRFDLVVFKRGKSTQIRRVIGLPGEAVYYEDDRLYIDGQIVDEKFIVDEINESQSNGMNYTENFSMFDLISQQMIPQNKYLLLGDNRSYATDSRHYGLVDSEMIIGVVKMKVLPLDDLTAY